MSNEVKKTKMKNNFEIIKEIEYAKDLLQNRPEQDTIDYKCFEVLDNTLDFIKNQQSQIAMLVGAQHAMSELMQEKQNRIEIEKIFDETYGVTGGLCPTCGNWIQSAHSFCEFCGQPIAWKNNNKKRIPYSPDSNVQWT